MLHVFYQMDCLICYLWTIFAELVLRNCNPCLAASQHSSEIAHPEMYASVQRNQQESGAHRFTRPMVSPGLHSLPSAPVTSPSCNIALKPSNLGLPLQFPGGPPTRVSE